MSDIFIDCYGEATVAPNGIYVGLTVRDQDKNFASDEGFLDLTVTESKALRKALKKAELKVLAKYGDDAADL